MRLVSQKANVATLEVAITDPTWLSAPGRSFPATIDPTFAQFGTAPGSGGLATWVMDGTYANNAYYAGISLSAGLYSTGNRTRALLRFDLSSLPADAVVTYAQLAMFSTYTGFTYSCSGRTVDAYALAGPFSSATTWNTQPAVSGAPITSHAFAHQPNPNGAGTYCPAAWEGLPVTPIVQSWMSGSPNHGVELRGNEADMSSFQHFYSSHTGQYQPYLQLTWDRLPNPATNVVATANAGGAATVDWTLATVPPGGSAVDWYVVHALNPDHTCAGVTVVPCATCTTATLTGLDPGRTYVFGVYPHNGAGYNFTPSNQVLIPFDTAANTVAGGLDHNLSVRSDGTVYAWGRNQTGQLGNGLTAAEGIGSGIVPNLGGIVSVAAGDGHSLALKNDGTVWAWGSNQAGELGDADSGIDKPSPVPVVNLAGISAIAAGCVHSLALGSDGSVWRGAITVSANLALVPNTPSAKFGLTCRALPR